MNNSGGGRAEGGVGGDDLSGVADGVVSSGVHGSGTGREGNDNGSGTHIGRFWRFVGSWSWVRWFWTGRLRAVEDIKERRYYYCKTSVIGDNRVR